MFLAADFCQRYFFCILISYFFNAKILSDRLIVYNIIKNLKFKNILTGYVKRFTIKSSHQ